MACPSKSQVGFSAMTSIPSHCTHLFQLMKPDTNLLSWRCNLCHGGLCWAIYECRYCKLRLCPGAHHKLSLNEAHLCSPLDQKSSSSCGLDGRKEVQETIELEISSLPPTVSFNSHPSYPESVAYENNGTRAVPGYTVALVWQHYQNLAFSQSHGGQAPAIPLLNTAWKAEALKR